MTSQANRARTGPEAVREARVQWRRAQIIEAATELMEEHGFHEMSVNALAKRADLSVGTIYQYVKDKSDILLLVIVDILDAYCRIVDSRRYATVLAYRESKTLPPSGRKRIMALEVETTGLLKACLDEAVAASILGACDTELVAMNLTVLAHAWALKHWRLREHLGLDAYIRRQLALTIKAILTPSRQKRYSGLIEAAGG